MKSKLMERKVNGLIYDMIRLHGGEHEDYKLLLEDLCERLLLKPEYSLCDGLYTVSLFNNSYQLGSFHKEPQGEDYIRCINMLGLLLLHIVKHRNLEANMCRIISHYYKAQIVTFAVDMIGDTEYIWACFPKTAIICIHANYDMGEKKYNLRTDLEVWRELQINKVGLRNIIIELLRTSFLPF